MVAHPIVRRRDRVLRRSGRNGTVAHVSPVEELERRHVRGAAGSTTGTTVRSGRRVLRLFAPVARVRPGVAVLCAGRRALDQRGRALPVGWDPAERACLRREGDAAGEGAPVGAARTDHAVEGLGVLPRSVRPAHLAERCRRRRVVHRRERAPSGAADPRLHRARVRDPVPRQHPNAWVGASRDRRGSARARLDRRRGRVSVVRPAVQREPTRASARATVHQAQHRSDPERVRARPDRIAAAPPRRRRHRRGRPGERGDDTEHPSMASADPARQLRGASEDPRLLPSRSPQVPRIRPSFNGSA